MKVKKYILQVIIILTIIFPLFFVQYKFNSTRDVYVAIGKTIAATSTVLILWMHILGARPVTKLITRDFLWINSQHKLMGKIGTAMFIIHPIMYILMGVNILNFELNNIRSIGIFLGDIALLILLIVGITSVFIRTKLGFRVWKRIHIFGYLVLPLVIIHALMLGTATRTTDLKYYWYAVTFIYSLLLVFRLAFQLGFGRQKYTVSSTKKISEDVIEIEFNPVNSADVLKPDYGQFIYVQNGFFGEVHPYSVTNFDRETNRISVAVKNLGKISGETQSIKEGTEVRLDGPYGNFTQDIFQKPETTPVVFIAGGIGVTPFRRLWIDKETNEKLDDREIYLIYGNRNESEMAYKEEIEQLSSKFTVVNVMSEQEDFEGEKGFITVDLLKKYLPDGLNKYEYYVCGPPVMIKKLQEAFSAENIPSDKVHAELFGL